MPHTSIVESVDRYEAWLKRQLGADFVKSDLKKKHKKMRSGAFPFLRATYWRWAERILDPDVCPELKRAPAVLAVGDIHLENFGTWRDVDGRLIWGVNDFDEAAIMPYALDLVRLGTSALLGCPGADLEAMCAQILRGYRRGLVNPHAIVLDKDYAWLRELTVVPNEDRAHFWAKFEGLDEQEPPPQFAKALDESMPAPHLPILFHTRTAGVGSLGRPRWVGIADWHGAPVMREAKAVVPSGWELSRAARAQAHRCHEIATGRYRAPDPWYALTGRIVVRRLSPNNRKIEAEGDAAALAKRKMLRAMGRDLAAVHIGVTDHRRAIERDLDQRKRGWLVAAVERAARFVRADYKAWKKRKAKR